MPDVAGASQPEVAIRAATPADARRLAEINAVTWTTAYAGLVPDQHLRTMTVDRLLSRWQARLADSPPDRITFVAELDDVPAGYAVCGPYRVQQDADPAEDTAAWGELYALYTHPEQQGRGAGTALEQAAVNQLVANGCTTAALWVLRDNEPARRWYVARGWRPDGVSSQWSGSGQPLEEVRLLHELPH